VANVFTRAKKAIEKNAAIATRQSQVRETARKVGELVSPNLMGSGQTLRDRYRDKYETELKKAKLYKAAQSNTADPAKIKAIREPLMAEFAKKQEQAKRIIEKAKRRAATLETKRIGLR